MNAQEKAQPIETGTFHGKADNTYGRAAIYKGADGQLLLRLTNFKTSNGPDVHVVLIAAKDAADDANFLKSSTQTIELGQLIAAPFHNSSGPQLIRYFPPRSGGPSPALTPYSIWLTSA